MSSPPFPPPRRPLEDGVLALRPWREEDVPDLVAAVRDPQVSRWTRIPSPYTEEDAHAFLAGRAIPELSLAIVGADAGGVLGGIGLRPAGAGGGQIGYWVAAPARGRGVAPRAVDLLATWAMADLGLERIEVLVQVENRTSQRVPEKAGFRREGVRPQAIEIGDRRVDAVVFSRQRPH